MQEAKRLKTVKIVTYDWLEDSLLSKTRRPLREAKYLLGTIVNGGKVKVKVKSSQKGQLKKRKSDQKSEQPQTSRSKKIKRTGT